MPRKFTSPYPPEFRGEAIRLVRDGGRSVNAAAKDLGVSTESLRNWVKQDDLDSGRRKDGLTTEERQELVRLRRENRSLREDREILKESRGLLRAGDPLEPVVAFEFIAQQKTSHRLRRMCRLLGVSSSGFYAWQERPPCQRRTEDERLRQLIVAIHVRSRGTYGVPRIRAELSFDHQVFCSGKRVLRLMRLEGIQGRRRRRKYKTTWRSVEAAPAPDLVNRQFAASRPDQVWVADIKYVETREGFLYLAGISDVFSRTVVGWSMADSLHSQIVLDVLEMALRRRQPVDVVHHSDQGMQYTSLAFSRRLREAGIAPSMGSRGDAYDNALAESFWSTLDRELLWGTVFLTCAAARMALFDYIEGWFNNHRRHSSLGMLSPVEFERRWRTQLAEA